nr:CoA transferase [Kibdelosporangium sp. MJ126-NF4]CEL20863.1 predicted acyl-CoA transferase/carnitine dehydratase [Kibdelosporangium sp. MJ126-NF4]CTQ98332.1 predicted acyl-CoA transferase/carnitine dehydratase [Kibdelosporangium sp. MJ126-NF4]
MAVEVTAEIDWAGPVTGGDVVDEVTAQAVCGVMHVHGRSRGEPSGMGIDYATTAARVLAGAGVLAGMVANARGGSVQVVRTSVAQAALLTVSQYLAATSAEEDEVVPLTPGGPPFASSDGVWFEVDTLDPEVWRAFWAELGTPAKIAGSAWRPFQFRYATATAALPPSLHDQTAARTYAEVSAIAERTGVSICPLTPLRQRAAELDGTIPEPWQALSLPGQYVSTRLHGDSLPLAGMVVLEAGRRVQAPLAAHLLSLLGASVIRVEPPGGDPLRGMPPMCGDTSARWLALNRHKTAEQIDIKDPVGRAELRELVSGADVFLHNWAPGKAEQFGLGANDLAAVRPGLVYAYTSGYADRIDNPPLGTDFMVQARTGLGEAIRPADQSPAPSLMALVDVLGGLLGAHAILGALVRRERTGHACQVESSLVAASDLLLADMFIAGCARRPAGFRQPLRTADGWCTADDPRHAGTVRDLSTVDAVAALAEHGQHSAPVTDDLAAIPRDPRFAAAVQPDENGCPAVLTPWSFT